MTQEAKREEAVVYAPSMKCIHSVKGAKRPSSRMAGLGFLSLDRSRDGGAATNKNALGPLLPATLGRGPWRLLPSLSRISGHGSTLSPVL